MNYREYKIDDLSEIVNLFYQSVHAISANLYTVIQQNAWAPYEDFEKRKNMFSKKLLEDQTIIVESKDEIVGFITMKTDGCIDYLYVLPQYQNQGIGTTLIQYIEAIARKKHLNSLYVEASIIAKKVFIKEGFIVIKKQIVERFQVQLTNYLMQKSLVK